MAVVVIDTIKPKNNGTFPVVEAVDVKVTNSQRLDAALNAKANQSDVTALQTAVAGKASQSDLNALSTTVAGKQNALSEEQLAAANSGITSELVTQIGTNTTAIAGKASQSDLTALETEVDSKADSSDLTTATANLQSQIDEIVTPVTQDAEVQNARVGVDGTSYVSLKQRLDTEERKTTANIADVKSNLDDTTEVFNLLKNPVNIYNETGINTTTGAKVSGQTGRTLYMLPISSGASVYFTQTSSSIMQIGFYSDATGDTFVSFAYNSGLDQWNKAVTIPSGVSYIGVAVDTTYAATALVIINSNRSLYSKGYTRQIKENVYISELSETTAEIESLSESVSDLDTQIKTIEKPLNYLNAAVNVYANTGINNDTGAKVPGQNNRTLYIIPVTSGDSIYFTQCSGSIMQVGYYSDAEATEFIAFAYNEGLTTWNKSVTIPQNVNYVGVSVDDTYAATAFVAPYTNYTKWHEGYTSELNDKIYISELYDLSENVNEINNDLSDINETISNIEQPLNMLKSAVNVYPDTGINTSTGAKMSGATGWTLYVMPVTAGEKYYITQCSGSIMQIGFYSDSEATEFIGFAYNSGWNQWNKQWTIPANVNYIAVTVTTDYAATAFFGKYSDYVVMNDGYSSKLSDNLYIDPTNIESDWITIGTGTDYPTITEGFAYARTHDKKVIIVPGVYDLVSEGIASTSNGLSLPKVVYAYGVTFQCDLPEENWSISPVNINGAGQGTELYGLKIECSNCRYCIHDERGYATGGYYHNLFKDLELIHKSAASATLINPQCIGGGLGNGGYIEIVNCVCDCKVSDDIAYHSYAYKSAPDAAYTPQTIPCTVVIKDSYLSHKINAADIGSYTTVMNKVYVSNCSLGTAIGHGAETNIKIIDWNNVVRS